MADTKRDTAHPICPICGLAHPPRFRFHGLMRGWHELVADKAVGRG